MYMSNGHSSVLANELLKVAALGKFPTELIGIITEYDHANMLFQQMLESQARDTVCGISTIDNKYTKLFLNELFNIDNPCTDKIHKTWCYLCNNPNAKKYFYPISKRIIEIMRPYARIVFECRPPVWMPYVRFCDCDL